MLVDSHLERLFKLLIMYDFCFSVASQVKTVSLWSSMRSSRDA